MANAPKWIAYCSLAILVALYVVGAVSNGSLRHEVQTLPLLFPIVLGFRQRDLAKWSALPCFIFWLVIMILIWLFLLGLSRIVTGLFLTVVIGLIMFMLGVSIVGIVLITRVS